MQETIQYAVNRMKSTTKDKTSVAFLNTAAVGKAKTFHQSFPQYAPTPLRSLAALAGHYGLGGVYVKDESYRFGLNAFKVLGGSYAMGRYLAQRLGQDISELPFAAMTSAAVRQQLGDITFTTATDGNHGRGVAWTAKVLKQHSVVYMPKGSSSIRLANIQAEGAEASITDLNYDDAVRLAAGQAAEHGWVVVQDTAWDGYTDIPTWIMQGYGTMAAEAKEQLAALGIERPTHIFIQAGVGSLAGAVQGFFAAAFPEQPPLTVVVEADEAACLLRSVQANDGRPHAVGGDMPTIMAGLACGEPNSIGWEVLRDYSDWFVACPDWVAAKGMRLLGNPLAEDAKIISGESGAVTAGLLSVLMTDPACRELREALQLNETSQVLLFSTEGDTDPTAYREIVWDGKYPSGQAKGANQ